MKYRMLGEFFWIILGAASVINAVPARAQYPSRPILVVVPAGPGGAADLLARTVAPKLSAAWGQPVIVESRVGASGNIGGEVVAKSAPDGYTLMFTPPGPVGINMFLSKQIPFDPLTAFAPVSVLGAIPNILIVGPTVPAKNVGEFVAYAKANPGKLTYGSVGIGTTLHLTAAMLAFAAGIDIVHVPYNGMPPMFADLLGSRLDFAIANATVVLPQVEGGRVRALAVASSKRFYALPNTPTFIEAGYRDFVSAVWMSFAGPAGMSPEIVRKWYEELVKIVKMPDVQARFAKLGLEAWASTPAEMRQQMEAEVKRWGDVIRRTRATGD